jgi:hypothetical protein
VCWCFHPLLSAPLHNVRHSVNQPRNVSPELARALPVHFYRFDRLRRGHSTKCDIVCLFERRPRRPKKGKPFALQWRPSRFPIVHVDNTPLLKQVK